jgi:hypothetical protein
MSAAVMNGTHRPAHKVGKRLMAAGLAITSSLKLKTAVSTLCGVRRRSPGHPNPYPNP